MGLMMCARRCASAAFLAVVLVGGNAVGLAATGPLETFQALEERLTDAQEAYAEAQRSHTGETDPRRALLDQMDKLADASRNDVDGAAIAIGAFAWSWNLDLDLDGLYRRFERIIDRFPDEPGLDDLVAEAPSMVTATKQVDAWAAGLSRLADSTKRAEVRSGARLALGQLYLAAGRPAKAKVAFEALLAGGEDNEELVALAKGYIFEVDHLQVGMVAPDFSVKTLDGREVSLASLRGKAVLLNFWASW